MSNVDDVVNGIRQIQQDAMDAKATIAHHCDRADVLAVIIDRADSLASSIENSRATANGPMGVDWVAERLREIMDLSAGTPGGDPLVALEKITPRVASLLNAIEGPAPALRHQLHQLVAPRVEPPDYDQHPGSVDDVADVIVEFVDEMDRSGSATRLRVLVVAGLQKIEGDLATERFKATVRDVLEDVTTNHLHPALRAAGVTNPEGFRVELHGKKWGES